ncbi:MAG: GNAT family N-acetyltransferase [Chloroflexota bacterium]
MNITFEPAVPADAEALCKVQIASFESDAVMYPGVTAGGPRGYNQIESVLEQIRDEAVTKIVAEGHIIVGGIVVSELEPGHYHLDRLYIDPAYHNLGIGSRAMQFIEREYPADLWTLNTPTFALRNQHFYEKFGYVRVGEGPEPDHTDIILIDYEKQIRGAESP